MVEKNTPRRRGRPSAFAEVDALDAAVQAFWRDGYLGTDLDSIAATVGATKPSLYRRFGDKQALFQRALAHYGETVGMRPIIAFENEADLTNAIRAFLSATVDNVTSSEGPKGCLVACVAVEMAENLEDVRAHVAGVFADTTARVAKRLKGAVEDGQIAPNPTPKVRARLLVDLMQGMALRARVGESRGSLKSAIPSAIELILASSA